MSETPQQYTQRIIANAQGQDPIKVQSTTSKKLARMVNGIPTAKLRTRQMVGRRNPRPSC